jgi:nicotinamidase-related amidase
MVSALVVIDVQQAMFSLPGKLHEGEEVVARLGVVLDRARNQRVPIFHVRHESAGGFERDAPGWFHHPRVAPNEGEPIIDKRRSSAFHETDFHARLQAAGIDHLVIGGMQTQMCVESTIRGGVSLGYKLTALRDGHTTFDTPILSGAQIVAHHNSIWDGRFARLVDSATVNFKER